MCDWKYVLIAFILSMCGFCVKADPKFSFSSLKELEDNEGSFRVRFSDSKLVRLDRHTKVFNGTMEILKWDDTTAVSTKSFKQSDNGWKETAAGKIDNVLYCSFHKVDKYVYPDFLSKTNLPEGCPLEETNYTITNYTPEVLPPNSPEGEIAITYWLHPLNEPETRWGGLHIEGRIYESE